MTLSNPLLWLLDGFTLLIVARVVMSWLVQDDQNPIVRAVSGVVDPVLKPLQRYLVFGGLDLSPIAVIFAIQLLQRVILSI